MYGWLGMWFTTPAWCANLAFFYGARMLLCGPNSPLKTSILALALSLDTFRVQSLPGGGRWEIYGYGLGAALWFTAFGVLLTAVAWRSAELRGFSSARLALRTPAVFSALAVIAITSSIYVTSAVRTVQHVSLSESEFLPAGAIKRGRICDAVVSSPSTRILLDGPLEISGRADAIDAPTTLLAWGIPVVRKGGYDFALNDSSDINSIYWRTAIGPASAILELSTKRERETIEATLTTADQQVTAFRQTWTRDTNKAPFYCPDYRPRDSLTTSPPRGLLVAGLDVRGGFKPPAVGIFKSAIPVAAQRLQHTGREDSRHAD
jgi:hypothetical protein